MQKIRINAAGILTKVRSGKPLVHHITNWVTIYDCANILKVFGASPVMAHAREEAEEMTSIAGALVLNIGTLTPELIRSMKISVAAARKKGIPVVLDVCGAGATTLRDEKAKELIRTGYISVIKGNTSEIARVAGENVITKGVDASSVDQDMVLLARRLAKNNKATVVVTGQTDIVTNESRVLLVKNGTSLMSHIVGTGCMATSMLGAFCAVESDLVLACASALVCFELAAECAAKKSSGPGTFKEQLFDCAFNLDGAQVQSRQKVYQL